MQLDWYFLNHNTSGVYYQYDPNGNLLWQQTVSAVSGGLSTGFLEQEAATHYYWLPNEHGDILIGFDQGGNSYAVYTDHLNTPRLVTKIENPQNPRSETDTANDLPQAGYGEPQGISPLAIPVWQWSYSPFGADLANGYEAKPTTIGNNFKPDLWAWTGLPETGGADPNQVAQETWRIQANLSTPPTLNIRYPGQYYDFEVGLVQNWWRTYEPRIGRYVSADPIGLNGGWNRFTYVEGNPLSWTDRQGLKTMQCTKPLNALGSKWGPLGYKYGALLYHQYSCVVDKNGNATCGGQDRGENGEGKPSNDVLNPPGGQCKEVEPDNNCFEQCLLTAWAQPRPSYGVIPFGTDCQDYDDAVNRRCRKQCNAKK